MEYFVVDFPEERQVTVNGLVFGRTKEVIQHEAGTHTVALVPATGYRPLRQTVLLVGTTPLSPSVIKFDRDPSAA